MICTQVVAVMPPKVTYTIIEQANHHHGIVVFQTEEQLDQLAGTDHLDDEVEQTTVSEPMAAKVRIRFWSRR